MNLIRTTTYFDPDLYQIARKQAISEGKKFYEFVNDKLAAGMGFKFSPLKKTALKTKIDLDELFGPPFSMGLGKKKLTRADYYEWF